MLALREFLEQAVMVDMARAAVGFLWAGSCKVTNRGVSMGSLRVIETLRYPLQSTGICITRDLAWSALQA